MTATTPTGHVAVSFTRDMPRGYKVCSANGCPNLVKTGRCDTCESAADRERGTAKERGYGTAAWEARRRECLRRDPLCVCTAPGHGHDGRQCIAASHVADHWPKSRRQLVALGIRDPNALQYLRGICDRCHNKHTAIEQPGGWNARD